MGFFDVFGPILGVIGVIALTKTDESVECEDSVFVTIDSGEIVITISTFKTKTYLLKEL